MVVKHGGRGPGHLSRWPKAASGASFDPATLFAEGEEGFWYEPAKLLDDQTATPSASAGDGDPVGYFYDHSGNGNHGTQGVDTSYRPVLTESNGKYFYDLDGVNDYITVPVIDFSGSQACTIVLAVRIKSWTNGQYLFTTGNNVGAGGVSGRMHFVTEILTGGYTLRGSIGGSTARRIHDSANSTTFGNYRFGGTSDQYAVIMFKVDYSQTDETELRMFWNGYEISRVLTVNTDAGSGNLSATEQFFIGDRPAGTNPGDIDVFGAMMLDRATTSEEDANINQYWADRMDWPLAQSFDVFVSGGDSNQNGAGDTLNGGVDISDGAYWSPPGTGITSFNSVKAANDPFDGSTKVGPGAAFCRAYITRTGRIPLIVHTPWGGTGYSDGNWEDGGTYYNRAIQITEMAMASRVGNTMSGVLMGIGTNDTGYTGDPQHSYADELTSAVAMIDGFRDDLPGATSTLPFVFAPIPPDLIALDPDDGDPTFQHIQDALLELPNQRSNVAAIDPDGLTLNSQHPTVEPIHFNAAANRVIGAQFDAELAGLS